MVLKNNGKLQDEEKGIQKSHWPNTNMNFKQQLGIRRKNDIDDKLSFKWFKNYNIEYARKEIISWHVIPFSHK